VDTYERRAPAPPRTEPAASAGDPLAAAGDFLRRLIPFPGSTSLSPMALMPRSLQEGSALPAGAGTVPDLVGQQAASLVSQAASILDEEMARGVLAARRSSAATPRAPSDADNPVMRQIHELVDNLAAVLPMLQNAGAAPATASTPTGGDVVAPAEVRPRTIVRAGQRATISMTVRNSENYGVQLRPVSTDLLGSRNGRIAAALIECTPSELSLQPGEERDIAITTTVPADAAAGCYSGLLVVRGVDYLRALVTIEVE
jgi:hypothetical protein